MGTVVLIGPAAVGKSTVGEVLGALLHVPFIDLDEVAAPYYDECDAPVAALIDRAHADGFLAALRWWQPARAHAAVRVVADHPGSVIAFGAGHSHFEDEEFATAVRGALAETIVVLLLAHADDEVALAVLRQRSVDERGEDQDWVIEGVDMMREWVESEQNEQLADLRVVTDGRTPMEVAEAIVAALA
ncbi:MAG: shikimate kinase [Ilumatobacteraceae bacterium]